MKKIILSVGIVITLISCNDKNKSNKIDVDTQIKYASFGDSISDEKAMNTGEMSKKYETLKVGDTLNVKFESKVKSVCKKKGCWMTLNLENNKEAFVKFKDYAFFVPKNAENELVIVNGKAYVSVETIEELKHYAKDAGQSQESIDSIVAPKTTYSFMADGVLIKK